MEERCSEAHQRQRVVSFFYNAGKGQLVTSQVAAQSSR